MKCTPLVYLSLVTFVMSFVLTAEAQRLELHAAQNLASSSSRDTMSVPSLDDWPQSRFDATQTGFNPNESILGSDTVKNLVLDWQYTDWNFPESYNSAVAADNIVFFSGESSFNALDATTGVLLWGAHAAGAAAPAVVNGTVYAGGADGYVYALKESTGEVFWSYPTGSSITASPTVANGIVYVGSQNHYLYALNASTGSILWRYPTAVPISSSPAVANGVLYFACDNLYALNATTGALIWKTPISVNRSSPAVVNGVVYVGSNDDNVYAVDAGTGKAIWKFSTGGALSSPAVANGVVYVGSTDNYLYALNTATGELTWRFWTTSPVVSSPAVANGVVYIGSRDKLVYAVDANTGAGLWDYWTGNQIYTSPVVANGMVYVAFGLTMSAFHLPGQIPPGFSVIHTFDPQNGFAVSGVTLRNGILYGVTVNGPSGPVAFQMVPWGDRWSYEPIATLTNGYSPSSRLVFGPDGNPYGTTSYSTEQGGAGVVYNLTTDSLNGKTAKEWHENVLYLFQGTPDGMNPSRGDLVWDQQGNIYGTTSSGGASNDGTVYELTCAGNNCTEKPLYSFSGTPDGSGPENGVVLDSTGNLYGTTISGGLYGYGTVFELKYINGIWTETVLYNFTGGNDGASPYAGVIFDAAGNLYGVTPAGGSGDEGTLFELSPSGDTWNFNLLYSFPSGFYKGCGPQVSLVMDSAGNLYGTSGCGGQYNFGTVFKLTKTEENWLYSTLHDFGGGGAGGIFPDGMLAIAPDGTLYGTTLESDRDTGGPGSVWLFKQ